jgi:hypothetical protein
MASLIISQLNAQGNSECSCTIPRMTAVGRTEKLSSIDWESPLEKTDAQAR